MSTCCCLTPRGSAAGGMPAPSEFYVPLSASGGQHPGGARGARARQLQALVRRHACRYLWYDREGL